MHNFLQEMEEPLLNDSSSPSPAIRDVDYDETPTTTPQPRSSLSTTSFNILNNMVGSGLLSIPWCMKQADSLDKQGSSLHGGLLLGFVALLCWGTFSLVGVVCERHSLGSFEELAGLAGFPKHVIKYLLAIYTWLSCLSYVLLSCDFVAGENGLVYYVENEIADNDFVRIFQHRSVVVLLLICGILIPFSRFKDLSSLRWISIASFVAMMFMVVVSIHKFGSETDKERTPDANPVRTSMGLFLAHPIFLISFTAHYNAPKFYQELENTNAKRFSLASAVGIASALAIYGIFGSVSYATFQAETNANVLANYSASSLIAVFSRLAMMIVVLTTYPLAYQAMKSCLFASDAAASPLPTAWSKDWRVDVMLVLMTALPAAVLTDIGLVLDYKGSVLGGFVSLLIPCMSYMQSLKMDHGEHPSLSPTEIKYYNAKLVSASAVGCWAIVCSIGGLITTTRHLMNHE